MNIRKKTILCKLWSNMIMADFFLFTNYWSSNNYIHILCRIYTLQMHTTLLVCNWMGQTISLSTSTLYLHNHSILKTLLVITTYKGSVIYYQWYFIPEPNTFLFLKTTCIVQYLFPLKKMFCFAWYIYILMATRRDSSSYYDLILTWVQPSVPAIDLNPDAMGPNWQINVINVTQCTYKCYFCSFHHG